MSHPRKTVWLTFAAQLKSTTEKWEISLHVTSHVYVSATILMGRETARSCCNKTVINSRILVCMNKSVINDTTQHKTQLEHNNVNDLSQNLERTSKLEPPLCRCFELGQHGHRKLNFVIQYLCMCFILASHIAKQPNSRIGAAIKMMK